MNRPPWAKPPWLRVARIRGRTEAEVCVGVLATHGISSEARKAHAIGNTYEIIVREPAAPLAAEILEEFPGVLTYDSFKPKRSIGLRVLGGAIIAVIVLPILASIVATLAP